MSADRPPGRIRCRHCQAECEAAALHCRACGQPLAVPGRRRVGVGTVMLAIALFAVVLGLLREAPGLLCLIIPLSPGIAVYRTSAAAKRRWAEGRPMDFRERNALRLASLGVVALIGLSSVIAFCTACTVVVSYTGEEWLYGHAERAFFAGGVAASVVLVLTAFWLWPEKTDERRGNRPSRPGG